MCNSTPESTWRHESTSYLIDLTLIDPDEDVRREAAWGLGKFIRVKKTHFKQVHNRY